MMVTIQFMLHIILFQFMPVEGKHSQSVLLFQYCQASVLVLLCHFREKSVFPLQRLSWQYLSVPAHLSKAENWSNKSKLYYHAQKQEEVINTNKYKPIV